MHLITNSSPTNAIHLKVASHSPGTRPSSFPSPIIPTCAHRHKRDIKIRELRMRVPQSSSRPGWSISRPQDSPLAMDVVTELALYFLTRINYRRRLCSRRVPVEDYLNIAVRFGFCEKFPNVHGFVWMLV